MKPYSIHFYLLSSRNSELQDKAKKAIKIGLTNKEFYNYINSDIRKEKPKSFITKLKEFLCFMFY